MILAAALLVVGSSHYTIQPIFSADTPYAECWAINDHSQVLCDVAPSDAAGITYLWQDGKLTKIPAPPAEGDEIVSVRPLAMNDDGVVVGEIDRTKDGRSTSSQSYRWSAVDGLTILDTAESWFEPSAIKNKGEVLAKAVSEGGDVCQFGILRGKKFTALYPTDFQATWGVGLTDKGDIAGLQIDNSSSREGAFIIPSGSQQPVFLQVPPLVTNPDPNKKPTTYPIGTNNMGWVAGLVNANATGDRLRDLIGGVWSPDSNFHAIGAGYRAYDINDKLEVVGAKLGRSPGGHGGTQNTDAFVCDSNGQNLRLLDSLVPQGSPHLVVARFINNKGEIVCEGVNPNGWYLLKPGN